MTRILSYPFAFVILFISIASFALLYFLRADELSVLDKENGFVFSSFTDDVEKGNSTIQLDIDSGKSVQMNYELKQGYEYPYAGISMELKKRNSYLNFSPYEKLKIKLKAEKAKKIPLSINIYCEGFSTVGDDNSFISYVYYIDYRTDVENYEIPLDKFLVPNWWYLDHNISDGTKLKCSFDKVQSITIESCVLLKQNIPDSIKIEHLSLIRVRNWHWWILLMGSIFSTTLFVLTYTKSKKTVFVAYQTTIDPTKKGKSVEEEVMLFLAQNYSNSELSIPGIYKETGVSETKIAAIIKSETGLTFKQYLNNIRLAEAKRLLKEDELSISEIAYRVGYNNVTHFNRVFKAETNISPSDFRSS